MVIIAIFTVAFVFALPVYGHKGSKLGHNSLHQLIICIGLLTMNFCFSVSYSWNSRLIHKLERFFISFFLPVECRFESPKLIFILTFI